MKKKMTRKKTVGKKEYINSYMALGEEKMPKQAYFRMVNKKNITDADDNKKRLFFPFFIILILITTLSFFGAYLSWTNEQTLVFDFGENVANKELTYYNDGTISVENPQNPGYYVENFYDTKDFDNVILVQDIRKEDGIDRVYARWLPIEYNIRYTMYGGTNNTNNPDNYTVESDTIQLHPPSRNGFTFIGWYDNGDFLGPEISTIPAGSIGDIRFYAKWEEI